MPTALCYCAVTAKSTNCHTNVYVSFHLLCLHSVYLNSTMSAGFTENPFASSHSLDANPFDDPADVSTTASQSNVDHAAKLDELRHREQDLERREQELANKAENIRRHGRNNWPPCTWNS